MSLQLAAKFTGVESMHQCECSKAPAARDALGMPRAGAASDAFFLSSMIVCRYSELTGNLNNVYHHHSNRFGIRLAAGTGPGKHCSKQGESQNV